MKYARKELTKFGATLRADKPEFQIFVMPQGGEYIVNKRTTLPQVREVVETTRRLANPLAGFTPIAADRYESPKKATKHFTDRFDLMAEQEQLTREEIGLALTRPSQVYRSGRRLAFERGRVIVICQERGGELVLITPLWASEDLWARNPRPGKEQ